MAQFYDELVDIKLAYYILPNLGTSEEADEVIDRSFRIVHTRLLTVAIERLPTVQAKEEFARRYANDPSSPMLLEYLEEQIGPSIRDDIRSEFQRALTDIKQVFVRK